tara:strand:- start:691 stop:897 length:207 start_codon:yes stop_codon:yes gene_type:complete
MAILKLLIPAIRQYKHNDDSEGFVIAYDQKLTNQVICDLQNEIINLKACLKACAKAANGGLYQYKNKL